MASDLCCDLKAVIKKVQANRSQRCSSLILSPVEQTKRHVQFRDEMYSTWALCPPCDFTEEFTLSHSPHKALDVAFYIPLQKWDKTLSCEMLQNPHKPLK